MFTWDTIQTITTRACGGCMHGLPCEQGHEPVWCLYLCTVCYHEYFAYYIAWQRGRSLKELTIIVIMIISGSICGAPGWRGSHTLELGSSKQGPYFKVLLPLRHSVTLHAVHWYMFACGCGWQLRCSWCATVLERAASAAVVI